MDGQDTLAAQVKVAIVRCLRMPIKPDEIADDMSLFDEGLGLDSIDALELVLELQRTFGVEITDEQVGKRVLQSVSTIVGHIETTRETASSGCRMRNCLTVDVEEWFHVCGTEALAFEHWDSLPSRVVDTTRDVLDLLDTCGVRGTFFVLGWIADRYPRLVEEIVRAGHEVGSHGHLHQRVYELTPERFTRDLEAGCAALATAGVQHVRGYRAPEWSINGRSPWALETLARAGFTFDSSMAPLRIVGDPDYPQQPHARSTSCGDVLEFPPLVDRRFGQNMPLGLGWGLRMTAPSRVVRVIEDRNARGIPVALAMHPWEIDPAPPRVTLAPAKRFAHYFRLDGFRGRLERILRGVTFAPMGEVLGLSPISS